MPSKIPRPTGKESVPERSDSQTSNESTRRTSTRLAAKTNTGIPSLSRTASAASTDSVESTSQSKKNTPTRGRKAAPKKDSQAVESVPKSRAAAKSKATSSSPTPSELAGTRPRTRSITRSGSVLSDVTDILDNSVFRTPSKGSETPTKESRRKSRANAVVELDIIDESDDVVPCSQGSPSRVTRSMRKKNTGDEEVLDITDNDFVLVDREISPIRTPAKNRNALIVKNLTKSLFTPIVDSPPESIANTEPTSQKKSPKKTPQKSSEKSPQKTPEKVAQKSSEENQQETPPKSPEKTPQKSAQKTPQKSAQKTPQKSAQKTPPQSAQKTPQKSAQKTPPKSPQKTPHKSPQKTPQKSPQKTQVEEVVLDSDDAMDWEPIPLGDEMVDSSSKSAKVSDDTTVAFDTTKVQTQVVCEQGEKPSSPDSDISVILLSEAAEADETSIEESTPKSKQTKRTGTDAAHRTESESSSRDASVNRRNELDSRREIITEKNANGSDDKINKVSPVKKTPSKKTLKSSQKKKSNEQPIENVMDKEETIDEQKRNKKGKKATALSSHSDIKGDLVDPVQGDENEQNSFYPELTFKSLFKRPAATGKTISNSLSELYSWTCHLKKRPDDLCDRFINDDEETIWQHIAHKNKQIFKEFSKLKDILHEEVKLHSSALEADSDDDEDDDEEEEEIDDEEDFDDEEEDLDDEEGETDLFNLKGEDLAELERKLQHGLDDDGNPLSDNDEGGDDDEDDDEDETAKPKRKFPKSSVDDKFFNLAEMDAFLDEAEKEKEDDDGLLLTAEDDWGGAADYKYEDFFGKLQDVVADSGSRKEKKPKKRSREEGDEMSAPKKKKSVHWKDEEEAAESEEEAEADEQGNDATEALPVLLGEVQQPEEEPQTNLKRSLKKLKETIKTLEEENLKPKTWELSGEVQATDRSENEILEKHLEYDYGLKRAPDVTQDFTEKLESVILQRIKDNVFDDVQRKKKIEERVEDYRNEPIEERESMKKSLSDVYEKDYQNAAGQVEKDKPNEVHQAIENRMKDLFNLIDALSHFEFTPPEARPEIRVVTNVDAVRVEEVGMMASTDAQLLAPEEVKKREKGDIKADDERTKTDKLRQRRKKKIRQRVMVSIVGDKTEGNDEKKKKKKEKSGEATETKMKSSTFFNQLQETVESELKEKTTKKKKVKSEKVSSGGSKFKL